MMINKTTLLATALAIGLAFPAYAAGGHDHGTEGHASEASEAHGEGHNEKPHFAVNKPENVEAAWAMIDESVVAARKALETGDNNTLHETGEKLATAIAALQEHPDDVAEANQEKLASALGQLKKAIDRLHHAAEDGDKAGAVEALDLIDNLRPLTKSLYDAKITR